MAKRRNLKKEKADRNKAYARQFSKANTGRFSRKRYNRSGRSNSNDTGAEENPQQD